MVWVTIDATVILSKTPNVKNLASHFMTDTMPHRLRVLAGVIHRNHFCI